MMRKIIAITTVAALAACATGRGIAPPSPPQESSRDAADTVTLLESDIRVERNGDTVIYRGKLTDAGLGVLRRIAADHAIRTLLIESVGGEIVLGMDFGNLVIQRNLDVVVDRACLSSCANYIFTAGRRKEILPGAVVAWHGSAKQPGLLEQLDEVMEEDIEGRYLSANDRARELKRARQANLDYLTAAIRKQDRFFHRIGVDEYVTRIGNEQFGVRGFFYMSVPDMATFGIENVTAPRNYTHMEPRALARRVGFPVTLITLD